MSRIISWDAVVQGVAGVRDDTQEQAYQFTDRNFVRGRPETYAYRSYRLIADDGRDLISGSNNPLIAQTANV